jgi:hypothetical protein
MGSTPRFGWLALALLLAVTGSVAAQVDTGSITGVVTDRSGAVLPGVTVSVSGATLIGGVRTQTTDAAGAYRFDRLPPGSYLVRYELVGFKTLERTDVRVNAAFTATLNVPLEVGGVEETITVAGESPTVDTKSNVQQTVMNQELLEGVPTGRDPWSLAKIIPGVQVGTYDVGGTQSYQQSQLSAHGSLDADKTFSIDGMAINWPGGNGGSTMLYYDQGMFEEVNYQTSAIPAEVAVGGINMNMVTKNAGNRWRGDVRYSYANDDLQSDNTEGNAEFERWGFTGGNPIRIAYDVNVSGGGALVGDKLWFNGSYRKWRVDKDNFLARNPDNSPTLDDNDLKNGAGKLQWQVSRDHRLAFGYNYNNKIRGHRVDPPPNFVENRAALVQTNPGYTAQAKYTAVFGKLVYESNNSFMHGVTNYYYQSDVGPNDIRIEDSALSTARVAAPRHEELPNYRTQIDNTVAYTVQGLGGMHTIKGGAQYARLFMHDKFEVNGDMYIIFNNGQPNSVRIWNTPVSHESYVGWLGFFAQDQWTVGRLTMNIGGRFDRAQSWIPAQTAPAGTFVGERSIDRREPTDQTIGVWRLGAVYDVAGDGRTAVKANYSRYGQQVGLDRVQRVHPFQFTSGTRTWTDRNGDRIPQNDELGPFSGFQDSGNRYADADGPDWPYSDEITAGIEHQLLRDVRVGAMYYHRQNRKLIGFRNARVPSSAYTLQTVAIPTGPGGTTSFYNLDPAFFGAAFIDNVYDNEDVLDQDYDGVEFTVNKRFTGRWQMLAGLTLGKNEGGIYNALGTTALTDLNDPNNSLINPEGIVGNDSKYAFRLAGTYMLPWEIGLSGTLVANQGYPFQSTYSVTRTVFPTLTRASQSVTLSRRGDERLENVAMVDLRIAKTLRFASGRSVTPQMELFNLGNAASVVRNNGAVGGRYLAPAEILAPRVVRFGFSVLF